MRALKILFVLATLAVSAFAQGGTGGGQSTYTFRPTTTPPTPNCPYVRLYYNNSGQFCRVDCEGAVVCLGTGGGGAPGEPANSVQFNDGAGGFAGDSGFLYFPDTDSALLGTPGETTGTFTFYNAVNGFGVTLQAGTTTADVSFRLPIADGTAGQCMVTDGAGQWSFTACGSGGGAPTSATYITLTNDATLTNERRLVAGTNITLVDAGANSTLTINMVPTSPVNSVQFNLAGALSGDSGFLYDPAADTITLGTASSTNGVIAFKNSANAFLTSLRAGATPTSSFSVRLFQSLPSGTECVQISSTGQLSASGSACGGGGGSSVMTVTEVSTNYAIIPASDNVILVDTSGGPVTITLTTPAGGERRDFHIKKKTPDFNAITLSPASGNIDASGSYVYNGPIAGSGETRHVVWDGTNWWIL